MLYLWSVFLVFVHWMRERIARPLECGWQPEPASSPCLHPAISYFPAHAVGYIIQTPSKAVGLGTFSLYKTLTAGPLVERNAT